jgi:transcription elongation GreA/GreB family factor
MTTTLNGNVLRARLLDACIAKQQILLNDFRIRLKNISESRSLSGDTYQSDDMLVRDKMNDEANVLNRQLDFAVEEMALLKRLRDSRDQEHDRVGLGAIVTTNRQTFFVSASLEDFEVDGRRYVGISTSSPLFRAMLGKKAGDSFSFRGDFYQIKEVL